MGKTFENLSWDDLCDLMCGGPEDDIEDSGISDTDNELFCIGLHHREKREMIRQTDNVRVTDKCYKPTVFYRSDESYTKWPSCVYLRNGKCELSACIRREDGKEATSNG